MKTLSHSLLAMTLCALAMGCPSSPTPADAGPDIDAVLPGATDAALPPGTFACGPAAFAEGQNCVQTQRRGGGTDVGPPADDAGFPGMCVDRPAACGGQGECSIASCSDPCVEAVCSLIPGYQTATLAVTDGGRSYLCTLSSDAA